MKVAFTIEELLVEVAAEMMSVRSAGSEVMGTNPLPLLFIRGAGTEKYFGSDVAEEASGVEKPPTST